MPTTRTKSPMDRYIEAFQPASSRKSKQKEKEEEDAAVRRHFNKMRYSKKTSERVRHARMKYGSSGEQRLAGPAPSEINTARVRHREKKAAAERANMRETKKTEQRMHQLAGMPGGRGNKELKRIATTGSVKETPAQKAHRQRTAQLKGMPEGRGTKLADKLDKIAKNILPTKQNPAAPAPVKGGAEARRGQQAVKNPYAGQNKQQEAAKKAAQASQQKAKEAAMKAREAAKKRLQGK